MHTLVLYVHGGHAIYGILQESVTIELKTYIGSGPRGNLGEQKDTFQYVPFLQSLEALLKNQEILIHMSEIKGITFVNF